ncbi:MAG: TadE/TadG family type IV pilus assembly protein [Mesorhizobium sp.]|jgi:Flp pilus assembly protein TadG|uniref:TadE/TadG family type IV pilus assembly protein n=1 Tax=Aquamicrobium soli TaxID=1811518 RepID=A0ABV7KFG3_9HYPH
MTKPRDLIRQRRFWTNRSGTSAIEFAMLAPIFVLFLFGMIAYGIYFGASHSVQQIAADAARTAISGQTAGERQIIVARFIANNAGQYPFINLAQLTFNAADSASDGNQFDVSVSYDARNLPIWNLLPNLPLPGTTIAFRSTIRIGGI